MAAHADNPADNSAFDWMITPLRKYAQFRGRASRSELWWYILLCIMLGGVFGGVDIGIYGLRWLSSNAIQQPSGMWLSLLLVIPGLAVAVRRLHDIGKSGWWYLVGLLPVIGGLILLVWFVRRGDVGSNAYGQDPLRRLT